MNRRQIWQKHWLIGIVVVLSLLIESVPGFAQATPPVATNPQAPEAMIGEDAPFAPGEVLVGFSTDGVRAASLLANLEAEIVESLDLRGLDGGTGDAGVTGYRLRVPEGREWAVIEQLRQDPAVVFANPNWIVRAAEVQAPTAVAQPETPFLVNDPSYVDKQWYLPRINSSRAWGLAYSDEGFDGDFSTIKVAIIDSGVDVNHPEFDGILATGFNYIDPNEQPVDDCGHGTHIAGLVGAIFNNSTGIAGVAPKVRIEPHKVLQQMGSFCGGRISDLASGVRNAADEGANIINLSVELYVSDSTLQSAVIYAANQGALLIAAGGNQFRSEVAYPARYDQVLAVAATTYNDQRASYSNTGTQIDIAAPGGVSAKSIYSTWAQGAYCRDILAPLPQSGYCNAEGTSMAAGIASGAAALVWSLDRTLTMTDVRTILLDTAAPVAGSPSEVGRGRLDIHAALRLLLPKDLQPAQTQISDVVASGSAQYTRTIRLENPSLNPISWEASLINAPRWAQLANASGDSVTGTARYGEPGHPSLVISPTNLITGNYGVTVRVVGDLGSGDQITHEVRVNVSVGAQPHRWFFPLVVEGVARPSTGSFQWEAPVNSADRAILTTLDDNNNLGITLPFTFTLQGASYNNARVYANGFVTLPDVELTADLPNACLPDSEEPAQALYGWWANLNPGAAGAQVSTFQPASNRFVIEFANVPTAAGVEPAYTVSFQIVLYANGDVGLNYAQTPDLQSAPPPVTVGVEASDGLFYNQITCKDNETELGFLPASRQSFLLKASEGVY